MQLEYFSYLVVVMWLAWRDLNGGADIPVYSFLVGPDVMDATYISSVVWHSPLSGQDGLSRQLQGFSGFFVCGQRTALLWLLMRAAIFGMQL